MKYMQSREQKINYFIYTKYTPMRPADRSSTVNSLNFRFTFANLESRTKNCFINIDVDSLRMAGNV